MLRKALDSAVSLRVDLRASIKAREPANGFDRAGAWLVRWRTLNALS